MPSTAVRDVQRGYRNTVLNWAQSVSQIRARSSKIKSERLTVLNPDKLQLASLVDGIVGTIYKLNKAIDILNKAVNNLKTAMNNLKTADNWPRKPGQWSWLQGPKRCGRLPWTMLSRILSSARQSCRICVLTSTSGLRLSHSLEPRQRSSQS